MPTATTTTTTTIVDHQQLLPTTTTVLSLKPSKATLPTAESSTAATLRSLYPRAAKAFLQRDFALTTTLLSSAFSVISPPTYNVDDELAVYRKKWDILRVTVETTIYSSPPTSIKSHELPMSLLANQTLPPQSLLMSLHSRSLELFTPSNPHQKPASTFLPHQILVTLVLASIKLGCYDVGRSMTEDWLARRLQDTSPDGRAGYTKILELYCMHILPRLEEWDYAQDFLQYERELDVALRDHMVSTLRTMHQQVLDAREAQMVPVDPAPSPTIRSSSPLSSRSPSPARSISSDSSSSTHTATPRAPHPGQSKGKERGNGRQGSFSGLSHLTPSHSSSSSQSVASAATSKTITPAIVNRSRSRTRRNNSDSRHTNSVQNGQASAPHTRAVTPIHRVYSSSSIRAATSVSSSAVRAPSTLALIRSYIQSTLRNTSRSRIVVFFLVFVVLPAISLVMRIRRRNPRITQGGLGAAEEVRRRLRGAQNGSLVGTSTASRWWNEALRAISDTVRMGGGGLA